MSALRVEVFVDSGAELIKYKVNNVINKPGKRMAGKETGGWFLPGSW
jgi:hypothetical protein